MKLTRADALSRGFAIDDHVYPPCAYKGERFSPTHRFYTYTPLETDLLGLRDAVADLVKAKGRFHTQQNYETLVATFNKVKDL